MLDIKTLESWLWDAACKIIGKIRTLFIEQKMWFMVIGIFLLTLGAIGIISPYTFKEKSSCFQVDAHINNSVSINCGSQILGGSGGNGGSVVINAQSVDNSGKIITSGGSGGSVPITSNSSIACTINQAELNRALITNIIYSPSCDSPELLSFASFALAILDFVLTHIFNKQEPKGGAGGAGGSVVIIAGGKVDMAGKINAEGGRGGDTNV